MAVMSPARTPLATSDSATFFALWLLSLVPGTGPRLRPPAILPPEERKLFDTALVVEKLTSFAAHQKEPFTLEAAQNAVKGLTPDVYVSTALRLKKDVPSLGNRFLHTGHDS